MIGTIKILVIIFLFSSIYSQAQVRGKIILEGRIFDKETGQKIGFAHVWNESQKLMSISDTSGYFKISAETNDTVVISALGYEGKFFIIDEQDFDNGKLFLLHPRNYDIEQVEIVALGSYSQFKEKFYSLKLPETEIDILRNALKEISKEVAIEAYNQMLLENGAAGGGIPVASILTPEEKQYIKLKEILKEGEIDKAIDRKYNRQIVADLTGLKEKELDDFIIFCQFDKNYLYKTSQYEILVKVLEKFEDYKRKKKSSLTIPAGYFYG